MASIISKRRNILQLVAGFKTTSTPLMNIQDSVKPKTTPVSKEKPTLNINDLKAANLAISPADLKKWMVKLTPLVGWLGQNQIVIANTTMFFLMDTQNLQALQEAVRTQALIRSMPTTRGRVGNLLRKADPEVVKKAVDKFVDHHLPSLEIPKPYDEIVGEVAKYSANKLFGKIVSTSDPADEVKQTNEVKQTEGKSDEEEEFKLEGDNFKFTLDANLIVNIFGLGKQDLVVFVSKDRVLVTSTKKGVSPPKKVDEIILLPDDLYYDPDQVTGTIMEDGLLKITFPLCDKDTSDKKKKYFHVKLV